MEVYLLENMRINQDKLKAIIQEELTSFLLEYGNQDYSALLEEQISEAEFLKRLGRKVAPYAVAGTMAAQSLLSPASAAAEPPERPAVTQTQTEVSQNMRSFLERYPHAEDERRQQLFSRLAQQKANQSKRQVSETYFKNFNSFARFIKSLEGYESHSLEDIRTNWEVYNRTASETLESVPVLTYHENIDQVPANYITRNIPAFYDADQKKIFINPFFYFSERGFNHQDFVEDLKEEYIHAVQSHVRNQLRMPIAQMQARAASKLNIFLPQEQTGISQEAYNYLTQPQEFHAKMLKLKGNLGINEITKDTLLRLMNSENPPEVLKVLNPNKIDEVLEFFNMVAKSATQKTSQIA